MFINKIKPSVIVNHRIEAEYYSPEKINQLSKLKNLSEESKSLEELCEFITDGTHQTPHYTKEGVKFLSSTNIDEFSIDYEKTKFITEEAFLELKRTKCSPIPNDILISKNGRIGTASVYREGHPKVGLFVSVALLRYKGLIDSDFICAFLNSNGGQWQFKRAAKTGVITNLHLEEIREINIPIVSLQLQKYIGDKIRQAEQLRAWGKRLEQHADLQIEKFFNFEHIDSLTLKPRRMKSNVLSTTSLSPEFARAVDCQNTFSNSTKLSTLIEQCKCGEAISSENRVSGIYAYYGASGPIDSHSEFNFDGEYLIVAQDGSIGCANVANGKFWANNHVWVLKVKEEYDVESICRFLEHHFPCWKGVTTGSVVPKVTAENLLNLLIPLDVAKNNEIGSKLRIAVKATGYSKFLTQTAKTLVEALIEGQLSEQQLIEAQQALEDGDTSLDEAILSKLTDKGYAVEGAAPLFTDIDELYRLLESAKQDEAQE